MPYLTKRVSRLPAQPRCFVLTYVFCAALVVVMAIMAGQVALDGTILIIGIFNAIGTYFWWWSTDISMSKTALYGLWADMLAMFLSWLVLNEGHFLNDGILVGLSLSVLSAVLFAYTDYRQSSADERRAGSSFRFYLYIGICFTICGVTMFLTRYWVVQSMPIMTFVVSWYVGCIPGALSVLVMTTVFGNDRQASVRRYSIGELLSILLVAISFIAYTALGFWAYETSQLIVLPIVMVGDVVVPSLIGLFFFSERKKLNRVQWAIFALGFVGCCIIATSHW
jgi:hypothetical protein